MVEYIRDISFELRVDTNKRTLTKSVGGLTTREELIKEIDEILVPQDD